jgi:hypothetical protein
MNLWVNRLGQLAMLVVVLFFFSCEDETSFLGFKNPNSKFDVRYIEIELDTRQLLDTNVRTSNLYYANEPNRFLVGKYVDPVFGEVSSGTYTQFLSDVFTQLHDSATYDDSVSLLLNFDGYLYGNEENTEMTISVHELLDSLNERAEENYHSATGGVQFDPTPLGQRSFIVGRKAIDNLGEDASGNKKPFNWSIPLDPVFGARIWASAERFRDPTSKEDSAFVTFPNLFQKEFKGIAIVGGSNNDKIASLNAANCRIILHYHNRNGKDPTKVADSLKLPLGFAAGQYMVSYNKITTDRGAHELASLQPFKLIDLDKRYIQAGQGIVTQVDFSKVLEFADTIPNLIIQSASLTIDGIEEGGFAPPAGLNLRALNRLNYVEKYNGSAQQVLDTRLYSQFLAPDLNPAGIIVEYDSALFVRNDGFGGSTLTYDAGDEDETGKYSGSIGGFVQQIIKTNDPRTKYLNFALYPSSPMNSKSVNRVVFDKSRVKLKIYYVKPTVNEN